MGVSKTEKSKKTVSKSAKPVAKASSPKKSISAKATTAKAKVAKKTTTKSVAAKKRTKSVAVAAPVVIEPAKAAKHSVLNIADHAVRKVSANLGQNLKKSEHWHVVGFTVLVIVAAYLSYQYSVQDAATPAPQEVATIPTPAPTTSAPAEVEEVAFHFPNDYAWLTQNISDDVTIAAGESAQFEITIKNSSKATWYRDGENPFRLGIVEPANGTFPFMAASVIGENQTRVAPNRNRVEMMQEQVATGETATFRMDARAVDWNGNPLAVGRYAFVVGFLVEGKGSLVRQPLTWVMNVR